MWAMTFTKILISLGIISLCSAEVVRGKINNFVPRRDTNGNIMDIHDGNTFFLDGTYYYYGASYGDCLEPFNTTDGCAGMRIGGCGFALDHKVALYTSKDFANWKFEGFPFQMASQNVIEGILFCPKVRYHPKTRMFVMWFNWIKDGNFGLSYYGVATSKGPKGPFNVITKEVNTLAWSDTGDFDFFADDNGDAYIIYTSHISSPDSHVMSIEKLTDDWLDSLGWRNNTGFMGEHFVEAPAMFKRNGTYYAVYGHCCCYCGQGSPVTFYTSKSALGPYTEHYAITNDIAAQQTSVGMFHGKNGPEFMWFGDRWQSAPDGIKGHDYTYMGLLQFDSEGMIQPINFTNQYTIEVDVSFN